jgi:hypothetical protein
MANKLQKTLYSFGVSAKVENASVGPTITRYELKPAEGVRVSKIANLAEDIALNLAAETIRIEAPIPGKQAVGIEIPNKENEVVHLREIIDSEKCTYKLRVNHFLMRSIHGITKLMQYGDNDNTAIDAYLFLYSAYVEIKNHINISSKDIMLIHNIKLNQFELNLVEAEACADKEKIEWKI